jgi:DNA-binding XRE family transcriptional regulator
MKHRFVTRCDGPFHIATPFDKPPRNPTQLSGQMRAQVTESTARRIEDFCFREGLSAADFGARCNVSDQTIYRLTAKKNRQRTTRLNTARAIATGMGLTVPDLFGGLK